MNRRSSNVRRWCMDTANHKAIMGMDSERQLLSKLGLTYQLLDPAAAAWQGLLASNAAITTSR